MILRLTIDSDCEKELFYTTRHMGESIQVLLPKYKTRLSEYYSEQLIAELKQDPTIKTIYLYKIKYPDGQISLIANPDKPIGKLTCK